MSTQSWLDSNWAVPGLPLRPDGPEGTGGRAGLPGALACARKGTQEKDATHDSLSWDDHLTVIVPPPTSRLDGVAQSPLRPDGPEGAGGFAGPPGAIASARTGTEGENGTHDLLSWDYHSVAILLLPTSRLDGGAQSGQGPERAREAPEPTPLAAAHLHLGPGAPSREGNNGLPPCPPSRRPPPGRTQAVGKIESVADRRSRIDHILTERARQAAGGHAIISRPRGSRAGHS
jgi:hypothetical protein